MCTDIVDLRVVKVIAQAECMFEGNIWKLFSARFFTWFCCANFITIKSRLFRVGKWSVCLCSVPLYVTDLWGRARHLLLINLSFCILKSRLLLLKTKHTKEWIVMEDSTWIVHWVFLGKVSGKPPWMVSGRVCSVCWRALWQRHVNHWHWNICTCLLLL